MKRANLKVYKKKLSNGMHVLVRTAHMIPEVMTQLWYNVGSKHESIEERGIAHLIEHMMFKGTKKLSETDIDLITARMAGYSNAFTSNDCTCYYFRFPSNVWDESLKIFSECMKNVRFDQQMLNSELHAVIQEIKLYKDEYQESLVERMFSSIFPQHPYRDPIIGYKQDLLHVTQADLKNFYKKYYHPANATLVVVGDVKKDEVFERAEKYFGKITSPKIEKENGRSFVSDLYKTTTVLPRDIENPWALYAYQIPGLSNGKMYLFDMIESIVGRGRSSRLYERLVNKEKLATEVGAFTYDFFERALFFIYVQPKTVESLARIESIIDEELKKIARGTIEDWELSGMKKKTEMAFYSMLESIDQQADFIGNTFLSTRDSDYFTHSLEAMKKVKRQEISKKVEKYLRPEFCHKGYLVPADAAQKDLWIEQQHESDEQDVEILQHYQRKTPVEPPRVALKVKPKKLPEFSYPVPKTFFLDNGLEVLYHHRPGTKKISLLLNLKADYLYEPADLSGMSTFLHMLLLEGTRKRSARELGRYIESQGMSLSSSSGLLSMEFLHEDFGAALDILYEVVTEPAFKKDAIEKVRTHMLTELKEFWDTPSLFVDALAKEVVYGSHPYAKNRLGHKDCIAGFSRDAIFDFYSEYVTPEDAVLVLVGDLSGYDEKKLQKMLKKHLGSWRGKPVRDLIYPAVSYKKPKTIYRQMNRDQVVLGLAAPSVSRVDKDYDSMAILDFIFTGGGISSSSRLYQLREQSGLFYTIGGSLVYGATDQPGMMLIKTVVSPDKVAVAEDSIKKEMKKLREKGVSEAEVGFSARSLISASVRAFESSPRIAKTFLFLKRCGINFDLFDKRGSVLSILRLGAINTVARRYCKENILSTIKVGRSVRLKV